MKKLIPILIFSLFSIIILSQNTTSIPKELYDAIVKDESPEKVRRILETGVNVNARDEYNRTPLYIASYLHIVEIIKILVEFGANVDLPDNTNTTPLNIACFGDGYSSDDSRFNAVKELIKNNADVNIREKDGSTALIRAVANGQYRIVELLIENGVDINAKSINGETALSYAKRFNYIDLIELIEQNLKEELVITKNGNVREGPGTQFKIVGKVINDQEFMKINRSEDWYKIELQDGTIGWINKTIIKEVIDITNLVPVLPEGFSPISNIMDELNLVASGTYCLIKNSSTSTTWVFELLSNADILELSYNKNGIGKPSGSKLYFDSNGGHDLLVSSETDENGNAIIPMGKNLIMFSHENGAEYIRWKDNSSSEFGPIPLKHLCRFIGKGSSVRFPSKSWVKFGDKQYRNGGFTIINDSIKFMSGTEVKTTNGVFMLSYYKWVKLENIDN